MKRNKANKSAHQESGKLIISLDFELFWGMRDKITLEKYKENLIGVKEIIPLILELFKKFKIHATWATIGFLFYDDHNSLRKDLPTNKPLYLNKSMSSYLYINKIRLNENLVSLHFAPSLIKMINNYPFQEIGSHTFSHYYCLEEGQNLETFKADLISAIKVAKNNNISIKSIIFPRNQFNRDYLSVCSEMGIRAFRGNQSSWIYRPLKEENISIAIKLLRFIDRNFNITGHNSYSFNQINFSIPINIRASRFLYWYSQKFKVLEPLRLKRILSDLTYAAKKGEIYHLWWHPHNFGVNQKKNMSFLEKILIHFTKLKKKYGMKSLNMEELAHQIR